MGVLFQVENDFQDLYANPQVTGKVGTDIQENRCTWFAITAKARGDDRQREILKNCYGSADPDKVAKVKMVFNELNLFEENLKYQRELCLSIINNARELFQLRDVFMSLLAIYNRTKVTKFNHDAPSIEEDLPETHV